MCLDTLNRFSNLSNSLSGQTISPHLNNTSNSLNINSNSIKLLSSILSHIHKSSIKFRSPSATWCFS